MHLFIYNYMNIIKILNYINLQLYHPNIKIIKKTKKIKRTKKKLKKNKYFFK